MCHHCIIEGVKSKVTRRGLLTGVASLSAGAFLAGSGPALAQSDERATSFSRVVDLTHRLTKDFPTYFGTPAFETEDKFIFAENKLNMKIMKYTEHIGTHFDAPIHFSADGDTVDEIPVERLVCPLAVIDVRDSAKDDPDYRLTLDDLSAFESQHGEIPQGACVAMLSGWQEHLGTEKFRGQDGDGTLHFPGFHEETAEFLVRERTVHGIAVDTLSLDHGPSTGSKVHYAWLPTGRYGIENVANLATLPPVGATLVAGAPTFAGGTGGPGRVMALV